MTFKLLTYLNHPKMSSLTFFKIYLFLYKIMFQPKTQKQRSNFDMERLSSIRARGECCTWSNIILDPTTTCSLHYRRPAHLRMKNGRWKNGLKKEIKNIQWLLILKSKVRIQIFYKPTRILMKFVLSNNGTS